MLIVKYIQVKGYTGNKFCLTGKRTLYDFKKLNSMNNCAMQTSDLRAHPPGAGGYISTAIHLQSFSNVDRRLALFPVACQHLGQGSYSMPPCWAVLVQY